LSQLPFLFCCHASLVKQMRRVDPHGGAHAERYIFVVDTKAKCRLYGFKVSENLPGTAIKVDLHGHRQLARILDY
jgi:hypothetical protein